MFPKITFFDYVIRISKQRYFGIGGALATVLDITPVKGGLNRVYRPIAGLAQPRVQTYRVFRVASTTPVAGLRDLNRAFRPTTVIEGPVSLCSEYISSF